MTEAKTPLYYFSRSGSQVRFEPLSTMKSPETSSMDPQNAGGNSKVYISETGKAVDEKLDSHQT